MDYQKLLNRDEVEFDRNGLNDFLANRTVLVTGAGGSIGGEVSWQCVALSKRLVAVFRSESSLLNLRKEIGWEQAEYIADVTDATRLDYIFSVEKPDLVIHCAAYKHVPLMESNPGAAIRNNVLGTQIVAEACVRHGAQLVLVSSDKAGSPSSVMGATKRLSERCVFEASNGKDGFCAVRLVNVIGSSGSVLEIWQRQIERGEQLTVTHPEMTRFFMTPSEAATLILKAASLAKGLERFVFDMDQPTKILDLAKRLQEMHGVDREIKISGIRPGEKLHEESPCLTAPHLVSPGIRARFGHYQQDFRSQLNRALRAKPEEAIQVLQDCIPDYKPQHRESCAVA